MPTPFPSRQAAPTSRTGAAKTKPTTSNAEWRCTRCDKLLGVCRDGRMHLRFARGHEYLVGFPVAGHLPRLRDAEPGDRPRALTRASHPSPEIAETRDVLTWPPEGAGRLAARQASDVLRVARDPRPPHAILLHPRLPAQLRCDPPQPAPARAVSAIRRRCSMRCTGGGGADRQEPDPRGAGPAAQDDGPAADCALTLMLLALWPGLDAIRRRSVWRKLGAPDEIASDILARTTEAIRGLDLQRVNRIAATVLRNVERDMIRARQREADRQSAVSDTDPDEVAGEQTRRTRCWSRAAAGQPAAVGRS